MKTRDDLMELCQNLDITVDMLERDYNIFNGGCVLVSWILAREFTKRNIRYKVGIYTLDGERSQDPEQVIRNHNLCHMSIIVNAGKPYEIGGEINDELMKEHDVYKYVTYLTPDEIKNLYEKYEFNGEGFDPSDLEMVEGEIEMTFLNVWDD